MTNSIHILSAKMIFNLIEVIISKDTRQGAANTLYTLLDASIDKIESMATVLTSLMEKIERAKKGESDPIDSGFIEKARPVSGATYAIEKPEEAIIGAYPVFVFDIILNSFRFRRASYPFPNHVARLPAHFTRSQES